MLSYCQRDPRWTDQKIGPSSLTIGRFGCTLSSIADLSTYFAPTEKDNLTPSDIEKMCKFTPDGLILWTSCVFPTFRFTRRQYLRVDSDIKAALKDPNQSVILQVNNGAHWVVALSTSIFGGYRIADPWFGDKSTTARYKQSITGAAYFSK